MYYAIHNIYIYTHTGANFHYILYTKVFFAYQLRRYTIYTSYIFMDVVGNYGIQNNFVRWNYESHGPNNLRI